MKSSEDNIKSLQDDIKQLDSKIDGLLLYPEVVSEVKTENLVLKDNFRLDKNKIKNLIAKFQLFKFNQMIELKN